MADKVVNAFNIFVDTQLGELVSSSNGLEYQLSLNALNIDAKANQIVRLSLQNFCMPKVFTNVNSLNSSFILRTNKATTSLDVAHQNYALIRDFATSFGNVVADQLVADSKTITPANDVSYATVTVNSPSSSVSITGTSNNVIQITIAFKNASDADTDHGLQSCLIQCYDLDPIDNKHSDLYQLLGGKRIFDNTDTTTNSMQVTINAQNIVITGYYPAQRFNQSYLYLRCNLPSKNIATSSLDNAIITDLKTDAHPSNILGKIPIDTETCVYNDNGNHQYFIDAHVNHLSNITFYVTGHHGKIIPEFAAGQATVGNLNFSMVLRVEIIEKFEINQPNLGGIKHTIPNTKSNQIIEPRGIKLL